MSRHARSSGACSILEAREAGIRWVELWMDVGEEDLAVEDEIVATNADNQI